MQKATEYKLGRSFDARIQLDPPRRGGLYVRVERGPLRLATPSHSTRESNPMDVACAEDSNVENIGSIMDKAARVAAAMTEDCWAGVRDSLCSPSMPPTPGARTNLQHSSGE